MNKITFIGIKEDNKPFRVVNAALLREETDRLPKGRYSLTVERYHKKKSNPQLGYLFKVIYPLFMQHLIDAGWEITSIDETDAFCKKLFAARPVINRHSGEVIEVPGLKREMTTTEMMTYVEQIRQWDAEFLGGIIPDPETQMTINYEMASQTFPQAQDQDINLY